VPVADLGLGGSAVGASRRVVVFDTSDGVAVGPTVPPLADWATSPTMPPLLDVVSYTINGWPARAAFGEPLVELTGDQPAIRIFTGPGFSDVFNNDPVSPGWINPAAPLPEPAGVLMMLVGGFIVGRRRILGQ